jgi:hypothetical protein
MEPSEAADILLGALARETDGSIGGTLDNIEVLVRGAGLAREIHGSIGGGMMQPGWESVAKRLQPEQAMRFREESIRMLLTTMNREVDTDPRFHLAKLVAGNSERLQSEDAVQVAQVMGEALVARETEQRTRDAVIQGLVSVLDRMRPIEERRLVTGLAQRLAKALEKSREASDRDSLASALAAIAKRLHARGNLHSGTSVVPSLRTGIDKENGHR